jgi:hypothetical protein
MTFAQHEASYTACTSKQFSRIPKLRLSFVFGLTKSGDAATDLFDVPDGYTGELLVQCTKLSIFETMSGENLGRTHTAVVRLIDQWTQEEGRESDANRLRKHSKHWKAGTDLREERVKPMSFQIMKDLLQGMVKYVPRMRYPIGVAFAIIDKTAVHLSKSNDLFVMENVLEVSDPWGSSTIQPGTFLPLKPRILDLQVAQSSKDDFFVSTIVKIILYSGVSAGEGGIPQVQKQVAVIIAWAAQKDILDLPQDSAPLLRGLVDACKALQSILHIDYKQQKGFDFPKEVEEIHDRLGSTSSDPQGIIAEAIESNPWYSDQIEKYMETHSAFAQYLQEIEALDVLFASKRPINHLPTQINQLTDLEITQTSKHISSQLSSTWILCLRLLLFPHWFDVLFLCSMVCLRCAVNLVVDPGFFDGAP